MEPLILNEHAKPSVYPNEFAELQDVWRILGFKPQPVIVIVGGAGGMSADDIAKVQSFFEKYLLPFADGKNAVIIDGGTSSGVMAAIGLARKLSHQYMKRNK